MIFYFTGTGNSLFAAKRLLNAEESLINIADAIKNNQYEYNIADEENVGFVFPVYFYTVPDIIEEFISKIKINNAKYIYAVITCGGGISQSGAVLKKILNKSNMSLNYVEALLMPDNSMLFYQIPSADEGNERLDDAERRLAQIKGNLEKRISTNISNSTFLSDLVGVGFKLCNKTDKFYADDRCIGCGMCAKGCPMDVIAIENNKPVWTKPVCQKCSACICRCPVQAIEYGKVTKKRNRYVNPRV